MLLDLPIPRVIGLISAPLANASDASFGLQLPPGIQLGLRDDTAGTGTSEPQAYARDSGPGLPW